MSEQIEIETLKTYPHHNMLQYCENRPKYRQGRKLTAVKVYTVNDESQHLLIRGVPAVNLYDEVKKLCRRYGNVLSIRQVKFEDQEEFTHSFHVTFVRIQSARFAKKQIDTKNFFGGILHVCYAPELETIEQTRAKLKTRIVEVAKHIKRTGFNIDNKIEIQNPDSVNHNPAILSHDSNSKLPDYNLYSQKQNRWLEGGLKCSYIIPKSQPSSSPKETVKNELSIVKDSSTPLNSKLLKMVPRQIVMTPQETKIKKHNRIIFHS